MGKEVARFFLHGYETVKRKEKLMKKLLVFIVIVFMVMFGFQSSVLAGTFTNKFVITEYNPNYNLNGTNCTLVKVAYPNVPVWNVITSTNLSVGVGWYLKLGSVVQTDSFMGTPRSKTFYIKNDTNNISAQMFWAVSTNKTEYVEIK